MQSIRDCVTNYMGFVLAGGGIAQVAIAFIGVETKNEAGVAVACMALACIAALVLLVLLYKFNSHNRYAGYCKLLTQEQYTLGREDVQIHAWEVCIDRLREYSNLRRDNSGGGSVSHIDGLSDKAFKDKRAEYSGPRPKANRQALLGATRVMFGTFVQHRSAASWAFPVFVVGVFMALTIMFVATSLWYAKSAMGGALGIDTDLSHGLAIMLGFLVLAWTRGFCVLHRVMEGSSSVMAFCWRFAPIRSAFLADAYRVRDYRLVGVAGEHRG